MQDSRARNRLLALLFLGVLMAAMDIAIVGPALPSIRDYFGVDDRAVSWVFTTYLLLNLIGTPLMAKLSDTFGRRPIYVLDVLLFMVGSVLVATAPSLSVVLIGRGVQGFGAGGIFPVASAVIGDTFPPEKRGSALGMIGAVFGLAFIIGPILGGVLLMFGWQWLFLAPLPLAVFVLIGAWRTLPSQPAAERPPFDIAGMVSLAVILTGLAYGVNHIDAEHLSASLRSPQVWPFLLAALVLLPIFARIEQQSSNPLIRPSLFRTPQLQRANFLSFGAGVVEGVMVFIPALLVAAFHVTESRASFMLVPIVLTLAIGAPLAGQMLDRFGSRFVVLIGTSLLTLGGLVISFIPLTVGTFYLAGALIGFGLSALLGAPLRYIMINEAPPSDRAAAQALISILTKVGQLLSGTAIGALAASMGGGVTGYTGAFRVLTVFIAGLVVVAIGLKPQSIERATLTRYESPAD